MPPLSTITILADLKFFSYGLKMPVDWEQPSGDPDAEQYGDSMESWEKIAIPALIPPWFMPHNQNIYHQDAVDIIGSELKDFVYDSISAVEYAHSMWRTKAKFKDLKVAAVSAIGSPGCLDGPELESDIKNAPSMKNYGRGNAKKWRDAVAKGVSKAFKGWQDKVTVPGLPWYPAFAAYPLAQAPPTPNVPMPLIACVSAKMSDIVTPFTMKDEMVSAHDGGLKKKDPDKQHEAAFDAIATVLSLAFLMWLPQQQVMNVLGKGPVPTYAPPYVPVGPVVGGDIVSAPGHLSV